MAKKQKDSDNQNNRPNRVRNRLVGLATLLFILAAIAPWILTDKSSLRTSTTPILQSSVVNGQITSSAEIDNIDGNTYSVPYAIDSETVIDNSMPPDIPVDPEISNQNSTQSTTEPTLPTSKSKTYFIQVIALNNKQKIEELVALLTLNSYNVRLVQKPGWPTALQVGPYAKKEQAEQVMIDLGNLTKLKKMSIIN